MTAEQLEEGYRADLAIAPLHDIDDTNHTVAVDFPHEVIDGYRTDWARGCWDDSFAKRLPVMVVNHDPNALIGSGIRAENLGDRSRLIGRFASFDEVPKARETFALVRDGHYPGWSFHYRNGVTRPHPNVRGARRYVKADMLEFSPVTFPSIPGANAVGIRSQEATLDIPTVEEILALQDRGLLDVEGVRAMIAEHHPHYSEHIRVTTVAPAEPTAAEKVATLLGDAHGLRDMVIRIGSDGTVTTDGTTPSADSDDGDDEDEYGDPKELAGAVDAALDEACNLFGTVDATTLPEAVQQGIALAHAAGVAVDELLEMMGAPDPDDGSADGDRAMLDAEGLKKLSDSDFAYIDSKGGRHLPIQDVAHVRNALARFDQTHFESDQAKADARAKVEAAAKKFGVQVDDGKGKRSDDPGLEPVDTSVSDEDLDRVLAKLANR